MFVGSSGLPFHLNWCLGRFLAWANASDLQQLRDRERESPYPTKHTHTQATLAFTSELFLFINIKNQVKRGCESNDICGVLWNWVGLALLLATSRGWQTNRHLESVINTPLQTSESTDHHNTKWKSSGEETHHSHLVHNLSHSGSLGRVELGHKVIGRVGNDGAEDTSNVTGQETDAELLGLGALGLRLGHDVLVEGNHGVLKAGELHHSVWDLSAPEWSETLVQTSISFCGHKLRETITESLGETWNSLDLHLDGFERTEHDISEELGTGGTGQEHESLVLLGVLSTDLVGVVLLEEFVQAELSSSLRGVPEEGGHPTPHEACQTLLLGEHAEAGEDAPVLAGVGLHVTLDHIERSDKGVCKTATKDTSYGAGGVVGGAVELDSALCSGWDTDHGEGAQSKLVSQRSLEGRGNGPHQRLLLWQLLHGSPIEALRHARYGLVVHTGWGNTSIIHLDFKREEKK